MISSISRIWAPFRWDLSLLVITTFFFFSAHGANRYWIASSASNWNNTANWSTSSGGAGGASVPTAGDFAFFDANGSGNCTLDTIAHFDGINTTGYTGTIDLSGFAFNPSISGAGACTFASGNMNDTPGTSSLTYTSSGVTIFSGMVFSLPVNVQSRVLDLNGSTFNDSTVMNQTGSANNTSTGNNVFNGNLWIENSGSGYWYLGNGNPDSVAGNLVITNSDSNQLHWAYNSAGNYVAGNITGINSSTSALVISSNDASTIVIGGNCTLTNNSGSSLQLGSRGTVTVGGKTVATNAGTGATSRIYLGNYGSVTFNDSLTIINNSDATNSLIYCHYRSSSSNMYNEDIVVESTDAASDGIYFGTANGTGTIASGKTMVIGSGGYIAGELWLQGITQNGTATVTLHTTGSGRLLNRLNNWGGNVDFKSARMYVDRCTFGGTAKLYKDTGFVQNDVSPGGNVFNGDAELTNGGPYTFDMGNGTPDTINGNLTMTNTSSGILRWSRGSVGNLITGDVTMTNTGSGNVTMSVGNTSTTTINGNCTMTNSGSGVMYVASRGTVSIGGKTVANNSGSGTTNRMYLGEYGSITFSDSLTISNSSSATNSEVYCNNQTGSTNSYNEDIVVESTNAASDGIRFGTSGGSGTLASGKTVVIGAGGYVSGELRFYQFTQNGTAAVTLHTTGTANMLIRYSSWGGNVDFKSSRMYTGNTAYNGTAVLEKTTGMVANDDGPGGNVFSSDLQITNSSAYNLYMGNGLPDTVMGNLTMIHSGSGQMRWATNAAGHFIGGNYTTNRTGTGNTYISLADTGSVTVNGDMTFNHGGSNDSYVGNRGTLTIAGDLSVTNSGSGAVSRVYVSHNDTTTVGGQFNLTNSSTATTGQMGVCYNAGGMMTVTGKSTVTNSGSGNNSNVYVGYSGDLVFNDTLDITNGSTANSAHIYFNHVTGSVNTYNEHILVKSTDFTADGILFGNAGGSGTLAATKTITVSGGNGNFIGGQLYFRNFTQTGATAQTLTLDSGATLIYNYDSDWGGDVSFTAPRIYNRTTVFNGTSYFEKTGANDDNHYGGNTFVGHTEMVNNNTVGNGSVYLGYELPDSCVGNLTIRNIGTFGSMSAGRRDGSYPVGGNLTLNNTPAGTGNQYMYYMRATSALSTISGDLNMTNHGTGSGQYVAYLSNSGEVTINGRSTVVNAGTGGTTKQLFLGNSGDVNFNGVLDITNSATATNSQVYLNYASTSDNAYNDSIMVRSTDASCDGIYFGWNTGTGTLAATKTISIPGGGATNYIGGQLFFRNFTQVGATPQTLELGSTATYIYNRNADWGGNVTFTAPRFYSRSSTFNGTGYFEKTGAGDDVGYGDNTYVGNTEFVNNNNVSAGYFYQGYSAPDSCAGDLTIRNIGSFSHMYYGRAAGSHPVGGDLTILNAGAGTTNQGVYFLTGTTASGSVAGNVSVTNNPTGTASQYIVQLGSTGNLTVNGNTTVLNTGTAGDYRQVFVGHTANITFNGTVDVTNNSSATNSQLYLNYNGTNVYNDSIKVRCTNTSADGIFFGSNGGMGTLAVNKTISIPGGGATNFIGGQLYFRNFTQTGATAHTFALASTATYIYNYDSNWGGDVSFTAPRLYIRGTTFGGTSYFEKTGSGGDASYGGNTFTGNAEFVNNNNVAAGYFYLGYSSPNSCGANLTLTNQGSYDYVSYGRANGAYPITGDVVIQNVPVGTVTQDLSFMVGASAAATIGGNVTITNNGTGTGTNQRIFFGSNGSVNITGNTTVTNSSSTGTTRQIYLGNSGDITFGGTLDILNSSSAGNSQIYLNYQGASSNNYNDDVTLRVTNTSNDGIIFGGNGGSGTLAATKTISIPGGGATNFIGGQLFFRNFTQTGATTQTLEVASTATYIYNRSSNWGGDLTFTAPRIYNRQCTYGGNATFVKTGNATDQSYGGNTHNGPVTFRQESTGTWRLNNNSGSDFNDTATFIQTGTGTFNPVYNGTNTFAGDINVDATVALTLAGGGSGVVEWDGTGAQSFNDLGTSPEPIVRRMTMNKASGLTTLNLPIEIRTTMTMTQGILVTTDTNLLTFRDGATVTAASNASFVDGPVEKTGNEAFTFPVGDSAYYRPISISAPANNSASFRATYFNDNPWAPYNGLSVDPSIDHVSACEYWTLDRTANTNNVFVTLSWSDFDTAASCSGVDSINELVVARWDTALATWKDEGNGGTTGNAMSGTITSLTAIASFSPFTLASTTANNPLPIELLNFDARVSGINNVELKWTTASEINNDFFTIERSRDAVHFEEVLTVDGAGNSAIPLHYQAFDDQPYSGLSYYRLKQTDFDGKYSYSPVRAVRIDANDHIRIYPNPTLGQVTIEHQGQMTGPIEMVNLYGQDVSHQIRTTDQQMDRMTLDLTELPAGMYLLRSGSSTHTIQKVD